MEGANTQHDEHVEHDEHDVAAFPDSATSSSAANTLTVGAIAGIGAAILHAAAAGIHADHPTLARIFLVLAVAQAGAAVIAFTRRDRIACISLFVVNAAAASGWLITRFTGIGRIDGLQSAEAPQLADTIAAALALVALASAVSCARGRSVAVAPSGVTLSAVIVALALVPGLADTTSHDHGAHADSDGHDHAAGDDHHDVSAAHPDDGHVAAGTDHAHGGEPAGAVIDHGDHAAHDEQVDHDDHDNHDDHDDPGTHGDHLATDVDTASQWPRPWDPTSPIDFSGVPGVTDEQRDRAEQLVADTLRDLPAFADVRTLAALGYHSIGDAGTGFEHYINTALIDDDRFLDPTAPESLVYRVDGADRTLVSAMFIAAETPIDDPVLTEFAGPLMQWHVHDDLCWGLDDAGDPVVRSVLARAGDECPTGTVNAGAANPMVHVWVAPHPCGPFAALEGHGAGQASVSDGARMDLCDHAHGHDDHAAAATETVPYDPELPIDLGGVEGVTPQQQAFAENLVASTVRDLPQWADPAVAEAAGFRSIGDAATGHEHYIQWDWIDDDVWLDPDRPESLVFRPSPDGGKQLVSAMFMLPSDVTLDEVPDWGGDLMQWHVHGDLCFTDDPEAPQVGGVKPLGSTCRPPLVDGPIAPMIHVWIVPNECGPFAALDGIAGGQVPDGEAIRCDHAHGSH